MEESECVVSGGDGRVTRLSTLLRQVQIPSIAVLLQSNANLYYNSFST